MNITRMLAVLADKKVRTSGNSLVLLLLIAAASDTEGKVDISLATLSEVARIHTGVVLKNLTKLVAVGLIETDIKGHGGRATGHSIRLLCGGEV